MLCAGGDLSAERLLCAYRSGIFPWFSEGDPILWWSPDPRLVLIPADFKARRSLKQSIRAAQFRVTLNQAFDAVIALCASTRADQGTWISPAMQTAYRALHAQGFAWSVETWQEDALVGGLYGVKLGRVFFGESMVSLKPDASKAALMTLCANADQYQLALIDCQVPTSHLLSLGASLMPRQTFIDQLRQHIP